MSRIRVIGRPRILFRDRDSGSIVSADWPLPLYSLRLPKTRFPSEYENYRRFLERFAPYRSPSTRFRGKVCILVVGEDEAWCGLVADRLSSSPFARKWFWDGKDIEILSLPLPDAYGRLSDLYESPPRNRNLLRVSLDIWRDIEEELAKFISKVDAIVFEVFPEQYSVEFFGVGNILYVLSEELKYRFGIPVQHLSLGTPSKTRFYDNHIHHYIFHGLDGVLFEPDPRWVFGDLGEFMFISFDLSYPVFEGRSTIRFVGIVVTLRNSFVRGSALILPSIISVGGLYFDVRKILPNIISSRDPNNIIVLADGSSPKDLVNAFVDGIHEVKPDARVLYVDVVKGVNVKFFRVVNGRYYNPSEAIYEPFGLDSVFVQFHRLRGGGWKSPRSLLFRVRSNEIFDRGVLDVVARMARAFQAASQTTYEYEYLRVPPLIQRADRISYILRLLSVVGRSIPSGEYPLGLLG